MNLQMFTAYRIQNFVPKNKVSAKKLGCKASWWLQIYYSGGESLPTGDAAGFSALPTVKLIREGICCRVVFVNISQHICCVRMCLH